MNKINENNKSKQLTVKLFTQKFNGMCMIIDRIVKEVEIKYGKDIIFSYYDIDDDSMIMKNHGIAEVPTLLIYNGEEVLGFFHGPFSKNDLIKLIENIKNGKNINGEKHHEF